MRLALVNSVFCRFLLCLWLLLWVVEESVVPVSGAWIDGTGIQRQQHRRRFQFQPLQASVGIFFGTSTGNTKVVAETIQEALDGRAADPVDVDTLDAASLSQAFGEHDALIVGTPTWNTGADTERSGTAWDELYYKQLPSIRTILQGKKVAVFGCGDSVSYGDNFADATGELFDVFENLGCTMLGAWSQEGYLHEASKSIRGDKFCGLVLDMVNQEDLTKGRVEKWVAQLIGEGILERGASTATPAPVSVTTIKVEEPIVQPKLEEHSRLMEESIKSQSNKSGFTPHTNWVKGKTMWTSADGRKSFVTGAVKRGGGTKFAP